MLATELIKQLQAEVDKHGDLPVQYFLAGAYTSVDEVHTYSEMGFYVDTFKGRAAHHTTLFEQSCNPRAHSARARQAE